MTSSNQERCCESLKPGMAQCNDCFDGDHCNGSMELCNKYTDGHTQNHSTMEGWEESARHRFEYWGDHEQIITFFRDIIAKERESAEKRGAVFGAAQENQAWMMGIRCGSCGGTKKEDPYWSTCDECD